MAQVTSLELIDTHILSYVKTFNNETCKAGVILGRHEPTSNS